MSLSTSLHVSTTFPLNYLSTQMVKGMAPDDFFCFMALLCDHSRLGQEKASTPYSGIGKEKKQLSPGRWRQNI